MTKNKRSERNIARLIQNKVANEWPQSVVELAGSWEGFPTKKELSKNEGKDASREIL